MNLLKKVFVIKVFLLSVLFAQEKNFNRFSVDMKLSFNNSSGTSQNTVIGVINVNTDIQGVSGKILLNYYPDNRYSFFASAGMIASKNKVIVNFGNISTKNSVIVPIYFGGKYHFINLDDDEKLLKPYVTGGIGFAFGVQNDSEILNTSSSVYTSPAAYIGAGADLHLSSLIKFTFDAGYNLISDFKKEIGATKNYSGAEVSVGIGLSF